MNIERATELKREAGAMLNYLNELHWRLYDEDTFDMESDEGPDLLTGVLAEDAECLANADMHLSWAGSPPGREAMIFSQDDDYELRPGEWLGEDGRPRCYTPSMTLTEGLVRARASLAAMRIGAKAEFVERARATLALVDEALAQLDLTPDDPIIAQIFAR